jgi:hypothetical protein
MQETQISVYLCSQKQSPDLVLGIKSREPLHPLPLPSTSVQISKSVQQKIPKVQSIFPLFPLLKFGRKHTLHVLSNSSNSWPLSLRNCTQWKKLNWCESARCTKVVENCITKFEGKQKKGCNQSAAFLTNKYTNPNPWLSTETSTSIHDNQITSVGWSNKNWCSKFPQLVPNSQVYHSNSTHSAGL